MEVMTQILTPAEFKTIRQSLNLSQRDVAKAIGKDDRYIRYLESGRRLKSPDAAEWLLNEDQAIEVAVKQQVDSYLAVRDLIGPDECLILKLPSNAPNMIVSRVRQALMREGVKVEIRYSEEGE